MKRYIDMIVVIICSLFLILFIINRELVFNTVGFSLDIWITSVLPALFPFFVISDILISYDVIRYIPKVIKNLFKKLFNVSDNGLVVIILSMLSGFPSNARNIKNMYNSNKISKKEGEHLLYFTHFSNPMFILGTLVSIFLKKKELGLINIIIGILLRKLNTNKLDTNYNNDINNNFGLVLTKSIRKSLDSVFNILGTLTVFLIISSLLINVFNFNNGISLLIKSILELTSGLKELSNFNLSNSYLVIASSCILSFGGLSVHMQVINELSDTDISYSNFFIGRIIQVILSLVVSYILCLFTF